MQLRKKHYRKESSTSLGPLEMDIVKMSPLVALLAEEEKKGTKKKKLTLLPSIARLCALVFFCLFLSYCIHGNGERAKTPSQRASSDDAFCQRARFSFFLCYVLKRTPIQTSFSYFFCAHCFYGIAENKRNVRPLSHFLTYVCATKVITRFIF